MREGVNKEKEKRIKKLFRLPPVIPDRKTAYPCLSFLAGGLDQRGKITSYRAIFSLLQPQLPRRAQNMMRYPVSPRQYPIETAPDAHPLIRDALQHIPYPPSYKTAPELNVQPAGLG